MVNRRLLFAAQRALKEAQARLQAEPGLENLRHLEVVQTELVNLLAEIEDQK